MRFRPTWSDSGAPQAAADGMYANTWAGRRSDADMSIDDFLLALDAAGMLVAVRTPLGRPGGFFAVRKQWDDERGCWVLRPPA